MKTSLTSEEIKRLYDLASILDSFFCDGIASWSILTKKYCADAADAMYEIQRLLNPDHPDKYEMFEKLIEELKLDDTGGGGGVDE